MKCLILAAGYATRLYPLTENFPKPLLMVGEKNILEWLIDDIDSSGEVDEYVLISNHKYYPHFVDWARGRREKITVLDDGTDSNENRLGAVKDVEFAINTLGISDDLLIIAGDNVLDFSLTTFISYAKERCASSVMRYFESDEKKLRKCGVVMVDSSDRIISLEEKPQSPKSNWCTPPFYFYVKEDAAKISRAITEGCGTDAPGSLVGWMCKESVMYSMEMKGKRYDIGNLESYEKVKGEYKGIC